MNNNELSIETRKVIDKLARSEIRLIILGQDSTVQVSIYHPMMYIYIIG